MKTIRLLVLVTALGLVIAACGDTAEEPSQPPVAGACPMDNPTCDDTPDTPTAPPPTGAGSGIAVDGGLTVSEALATDATGVLAVKGFLYGDADGWRLCEVLAESMPPQCGEPSLELPDFTAELAAEYAAGLQQSQGISWTDELVTLFGDLDDGAFVINPMVTG